ncbi:MAG: response regulator [Algicola sp.]|nr:response regulator [Algicola sp.]
MNKQVLLVDDNAMVRKMLKSVICAAGYDIVEACDGLDGLTKAKNNSFDAFVIDYKMPVMNGTTLIKGLKEMAQYAALPMILLTTDDGAEFENKIAAIDNIDVLYKPVDQTRLLELLHQQTTEMANALSA